MDYAQAVARVLNARIAQARTTTARATVTAVTSDGFVTFTDAIGATRKGVWLSQQPAVGDVITYLDEGSGFPLVLGTSGDRAWTAVTFQNSWANFNAGWETVSYRKVGDIVYLRGLALTAASGVTVFALPAGFRPPVSVLFGAVGGNGASTPTAYRVDVNSNGNVSVVHTASGPDYFTFSGIHFSTTT